MIIIVRGYRYALYILYSVFYIPYSLHLLTLTSQYDLMEKHARLRKKIHSLRFALSEENLQLMPEFHTRVHVLQRLHYVDDERSVLLKVCAHWYPQI